MNEYKVFIGEADKNKSLNGSFKGVIGSEVAPGGIILTFRCATDACGAMKVLRDSGYTEVIHLW